MIITATKELRISGKKIYPGRHNYPGIDHKVKAIADQLKVLRDDMGMIVFGEVLYMDKGGSEVKDVPITGEAIAKPVEEGSSDSSGGGIPDEKTDESSSGSDVPKRRYGKNKSK